MLLRQILHQLNFVSYFIDEIKLWVKEEFLEWVKKEKLCGRSWLVVEKKSSSERRPEEKKSESKEKWIWTAVTGVCLLTTRPQHWLTKFQRFWTLACNFPCFFFLIYFSLNKASLKQHSGSLVVQNLAEAGLKVDRYASALLYFNL